MLLRSCLIHIGIIMLRHCDIFFIFIFIFIMINRVTCSFAYVLEYALLLLDDNVNEACE